MITEPAPPYLTSPALHSARHYLLDRWVVVELSGQIDSAAESAVERELAGAIGPARTDVIVDLTSVTFLDSRGLRAVARTRDRVAQSGGSLQIVCPPGVVREHLRILMGERWPPVLPELGSAMAAGAPPHWSPGTGNGQNRA